MSSKSSAMVQLVSASGGDISVVNSLSLSSGYANHRALGDPGKPIEITDQGMAKITRALKEGDGKHFEHATMTFYVCCPVFVANGWSKGVHFDNLDTYTPLQFRDRKNKNIDGDVNHEAQGLLENAYRASKRAYEGLVDLGVSEEHARLIIPQGQYTEFYWTIDARSLMQFLEARTAPSVMKEIQTYAKGVETYWARVMPVTHAAFVANERVAP